MEESSALLALNPRPKDYLSLLDEKILVKIFKYLNLYELLQISEVDVNYQRIIGEHIISHQVLIVSSVSQHYDTRKLFKQFGEYATKLIIRETDIQYKDDQHTFIEEIFRLIDKRCTVGRLQAISIFLNRDSDQHTIRTVPDAFSEISSVFISGTYTVNNFDSLLKKMISKCMKLRSLELYYVRGNWNFIIYPQLQMLQSLKIECCRIPRSVWLHFFALGIQSLETLVIRFCEFFYDIPVISNHKTFNECIFYVIGFSFPNLKNLALQCYHYGTYIKYFEYIEKLEQLSINAHERIIVSDNIKLLTNLNSIELTKNISIHIFEEFLKLPSLTKFKLNTFSINVDIVKAIVSASRYLQTLYINSRSPKFPWKFYNSLVNERATRWPDAPPLHMYARFKEFKRHKSNVITIHRIN